MKAAALRGALSDRARDGRIHVVSSLVEGDKPSTTAAVSVLEHLSDRRHVLVVLERADAVSWKSLRNVDRVHLIVPDQLNTYDVLVSDDVVFTRAAFESFLAGPARGKSAKAVATESQAAVEPEAVEPEAKAAKPAAKTAKPAARAAKPAAKAVEPESEADLSGAGESATLEEGNEQ